MGLWASIKKNKELAKIQKELGKPKSFSLDDLLNDNSEQYKEALFDMVEKYDFLRSVIIEHNANRDDLKNIYRMLIMAGAGQWIKGNFVATAAFAFSQTLDFILTKYEEEDTNWSEVSFQLIMYFEKGKLGAI
ncbi:hypothetical protein [Neobacillus citreus]|uniref:Uncharacterized protein n=1 Tax=Neobacillus citreus TaxID=2833578 RepID=A0A942STW7_9BACI|nr:hypothetical protein [Neobacillus citreus]MCH6269667.1 hypothetical protein [Neobacillus citreus]